jgi:hypothetical protein
VASATAKQQLAWGSTAQEHVDRKRIPRRVIRIGRRSIKWASASAAHQEAGALGRASEPVPSTPGSESRHQLGQGGFQRVGAELQCLAFVGGHCGF